MHEVKEDTEKEISLERENTKLSWQVVISIGFVWIGAVLICYVSGGSVIVSVFAIVAAYDLSKRVVDNKHFFK